MRPPSGNDIRDQIVALLPRLRRFAFSLTSSTTDADDLVQTACERALSREHQWRPGTRLDSWMFRIIHTLRIDQTRSMRERRPHTPLQEAVFQPPVGVSEKNRMEARLTLDHVIQAMQHLSESDRAILSLVCVDGQSYREAATVLQVPVGTVMSRLARARKKLYVMVHNNNARTEVKKWSN